MALIKYNKKLGNTDSEFPDVGEIIPNLYVGGLTAAVSFAHAKGNRHILTAAARIAQEIPTENGSESEYP